MDLYAKASTLDPTNFEAISGIVETSLRLGNSDLARQKIDVSAASGVSDPAFLAGLHYLRSRTFEAEGNVGGAETELQAAMAADPQYLQAYTGYAALLVKQNRTDEAIIQYQTAIQKRPAAQIYTLLGMLEESRNRFDDAAAAYRKALEISPDQPIAANNLAWLLAERQGNLDEALQLASAAVEKGPEVAGFQDTLGFVYLQKGLNLPAIQKFRRAIALEEAYSRKTGSPPNPGYKPRLGIALSKAGERASASREPRV
jgi:Flp pilus assembly protein TadD